MIKNKVRLNKFYKELIRKEKLPYSRALSIYEELHKEALMLGIINSENISEGLEVDIKIAKIINGLR